MNKCKENVRFVEIVSHSMKLVDGHYSLKMPFRKEQLILPNNLSVAKQRIWGLKRRFEKDERFHQEYTNFFTDIIVEATKRKYLSTCLMMKKERFGIFPIIVFIIPGRILCRWCSTVGHGKEELIEP